MSACISQIRRVDGRTMIVASVKPAGDGSNLVIFCGLTPDGRIDFGSARAVRADADTMDRDYPLIRAALPAPLSS